MEANTNFVEVKFDEFQDELFEIVNRQDYDDETRKWARSELSNILKLMITQAAWISGVTIDDLP